MTWSDDLGYNGSDICGVILTIHALYLYYIYLN